MTDQIPKPEDFQAAIEQLKKLIEEQKECKHVPVFTDPGPSCCPKCGYCPCCGRGGYYQWSYYQPYPQFPSVWCDSGTSTTVTPNVDVTYNSGYLQMDDSNKVTGE